MKQSATLELCKMSIKTDIVEAPIHWNAYLINGDCSGMDEEQIEACDKYFAGMQVIDCNTETERFTNCADLFGSTSKGDTVCEYTVIV
jgi:hypothetical protein